ncbi:mini-chromosome maintenance complex-binding protein [Topomyia yanbarensis]|uniref:mini-chromosome maintenance complex-binding protein n=1 Tax=Topomyia yanbarensis TaxID=2498891 RepID=UPI00273C10FE|nr:mini-chromosome maintenance complex-binding protein [Topomyia yanbarensis]
MDIDTWTPEYFAENVAQCEEYLIRQEVRDRIPLLNCTHLHDLRDNTLVRFRGMIQDMQDPECYLERYEVRRKENNEVVRVQNGKYRDILVINKDTESIDFKAAYNHYGERRSMFVISIPAYNSWALEHEAKVNGRNQPNLRSMSSHGSGCNKRTLETDEEVMETDDDDTEKILIKKPSIPAETSFCSVVGNSSSTGSCSNKCNRKIISAEYLLNSPISERPSKACLVKLYSGIEDSKLNTLVDVIGFLSVDPALDGSTDQIEDFEDEMSEHHTTHPPPSLIPRIHAVSVLNLKHGNPLLPISSDQSTCNSAIWKDIQNLLTQCLFEDKIAADYLLCHLISTVYIRNELESLGQFSLNLGNIPIEALPDYTKWLYEILELLLPASHYFPMTLENMNTRQFVPKKDYTTNKLTSGLLQLAPHTHLLLDETRLQTGKLEASGVEAVQSIAHLIKTQKLKYNFQFYQLEFNADVPVLILSEGKSMLPSNCYLPMIPDVDAVKLIAETLKAGKHFIQPKLNDMRNFLTLQRIQEFDMKTFDPEIIQNDFIQMRKESDASAEDLHSLLVLARLIGLSRGKNMLDQDCWEYAKQLERERKHRIDTLTKRPNEP